MHAPTARTRQQAHHAAATRLLPQFNDELALYLEEHTLVEDTAPRPLPPASARSLALPPPPIRRLPAALTSTPTPAQSQEEKLAKRRKSFHKSVTARQLGLHNEPGKGKPTCSEAQLLKIVQKEVVKGKAKGAMKHPMIMPVITVGFWYVQGIVFYMVYNGWSLSKSFFYTVTPPPQTRAHAAHPRSPCRQLTRSHHLPTSRARALAAATVSARAALSPPAAPACTAPCRWTRVSPSALAPSSRAPTRTTRSRSHAPRRTSSSPTRLQWCATRRVPRVATPQQYGGREEGEAGEGEGAGVCGARDECGGGGGVDGGG